MENMDNENKVIIEHFSTIREVLDQIIAKFQRNRSKSNSFKITCKSTSNEPKNIEIEETKSMKQEREIGLTMKKI